ncbi:SPOR domain-containing protein [Thalassotalea sp. 1_MG-2023]|uniref:SPOR domain-containing protein n=1 Tax=Thalassotalea sp. 1_MG-2023 TaxID=3062680 RepID=UPI0026E16682|nr:SPOR domain-containing protein [Thalassotalea sp. 1_MG-2023]MDO6427968.1 SPOR domain-containing protein [Thalassotalea sp. 1_MG-2023]
MSTPFQNRLVGTIIVAAVAIIFLPDLLDGEKQTYQEEFENIPTAPKVDFKPNSLTIDEDKIAKLPKEELTDEVALDDNNQEKAPVEQDANNKLESDVGDNSNQPVSSDSKVTALPEKITDEQAWVIQLGSFRHKKNVADLTRKLKKAGYTVFTKPINTKSGTLTKVFIGPELVKSSLEKKLPALKELTKVQGKIAKFQPTK